MVSGSCKKDAVWNSSAVLARQDEVEIIGAGQAITKVIGSSEEGTVDSVLACLNSIILFSCSYQLISLATMPVHLHAPPSHRTPRWNAS